MTDPTIYSHRVTATEQVLQVDTGQLVPGIAEGDDARPDLRTFSYGVDVSQKQAAVESLRVVHADLEADAQDRSARGTVGKTLEDLSG